MLYVTLLYSSVLSLPIFLHLFREQTKGLTEVILIQDITTLYPAHATSQLIEAVHHPRQIADSTHCVSHFTNIRFRVKCYSICEQVPKSIALELLHLPAAGYPFATKNLKEQNIYF